MTVGGEGIAYAELAHHGEASAIGEGPCLVFMLAEPVGGGMKARWIDPFQPEGLAPFDRIEPS